MTTPINQSIIKAFELLQIVCVRHPSPSLREVAAEAEMSLATTHRILSTLKRGRRPAVELRRHL
jgi:DNA-binding IclR family transcriptional regulator